MKKLKLFKRVTGLLIAAAMMASTLAGCGGSSGSKGEDGKELT